MNQQQSRLDTLNYLRAFNISQARKRLEQMPDDEGKTSFLKMLEAEEAKILKEISPCKSKQ